MRLDFGHALRDFMSKNQEAREYAAKELLKESGEKGAVDGVIAHHPQLGFRAGVMAALAVPDRYAEEAARYLGAWHGLLTQDPDMVAFTIRESGGDKLHHLTAPVPPQELAQHLRDAGVLKFAIRPGEGSSTAHIYDKGGVYDFTPLAEKLHGSVYHSVGSGRRLGEGAGADAGYAAAYRAHVKRAESAAAAPADPETDRLRLARVKWDEQPGGFGKRASFPVGDSVYHVNIVRASPQLHHVMFERETPEGKFQTGITGSGGAREVLRQVVEHLKDHAAAEQPRIIRFTSEEPSRRKLYSYLAKQLSGGSGYHAYETDASGPLRDHFLVHDRVNEVWKKKVPQARFVTPAEQPRKLAREGPRKAPPLSSYGEHVPLYHYGAVSGGTVDPEQFGKNRHTSAEAKHVPEPKRAFFYTHPEEREAFFGEGTPKHEGTYPTKHIYDLVTDPDNVKADWGVDALKRLAAKGYHGVYYGDYDPIVALWKPVAVTRLARPTNREFKVWQAAVHKAPDDRVARGAFADWLEERGFHEDDDTLHTLRHHDGPVSLIRTGYTEKGKVRAIAGEPEHVAAVRSLMGTSGFPQSWYGLHTVTRLPDGDTNGHPHARYNIGWKRAARDHRSSTLTQQVHPDNGDTTPWANLYDDYNVLTGDAFYHPDMATARRTVLARRR